MIDNVHGTTHRNKVVDKITQRKCGQSSQTNHTRQHDNDATGIFVKIGINGTERSALLDTGSDTNIMSKQAFEQMKDKQPNLKLKHTKAMVTRIDGGISTPLGKVRTKITIHGKTSNIQFVVLEKSDTAIILGLTFMTERGFNLQLKRKTYTLDDETEITKLTKTQKPNSVNSSYNQEEQDDENNNVQSGKKTEKLTEARMYRQKRTNRVHRKTSSTNRRRMEHGCSNDK
jgi:hypothetical protein